MFENYGGQVMEIQSNTAIIHFTSKPFAERYYNQILQLHFTSNLLYYIYLFCFYVSKFCLINLYTITV